jgi:hypothetical protein
MNLAGAYYRIDLFGRTPFPHSARPRTRLAAWWSRYPGKEYSAISSAGSFSVGRSAHRRHPIAGAGRVQFWSPASIARFRTQDAGWDILNHHQELFGEEADSGAKNGPGARVCGETNAKKRAAGFCLFWSSDCSCRVSVSKT